MQSKKNTKRNICLLQVQNLHYFSFQASNFNFKHKIVKKLNIQMFLTFSCLHTSSLNSTIRQL